MFFLLEQTCSRNRKCRMTTTGSSKCSAIKFFFRNAFFSVRSNGCHPIIKIFSPELKIFFCYKKNSLSLCLWTIETWRAMFGKWRAAGQNQWTGSNLERHGKLDISTNLGIGRSKRNYPQKPRRSRILERWRGRSSLPYLRKGVYNF